MIAQLLMYFPAVFRQLAKLCGMPYKIGSSGVPVILVPNGTIATNGTITLLTALPRTYSNGAWIRLPAGAVSGGAAGLYWCVFSSTTVGAVKTLFVDPATGFIPYIPTGTLTAATGSNVAYTQVLTESILAVYTIPGGTLGINGAARVTVLWAHINNANTKTERIKLGGSNINGSRTATTTNTYQECMSVTNRGMTNAQIYQAAYNGGFGADTSPAGTGTVDTTTNQLIYLSGQLAVATDYIIVETSMVEVVPS